MTRLALGGKCGPSRIPLSGLIEAGAAANRSRLSNPNRAAPPRPKAKRPKKSRRFIWKFTCEQFIILRSSPHNRLIVVEQCFCEDRARRKVGWVQGSIVFSFPDCE